MPTPLYTTDVRKIVERTPKTALLDTDVFVVADDEGTLSPITKTNTKETLGVNAKEDSSNKKSTLAENSEVYYPNQKAVNDGLDTKTSKSQITYDNDTTSFIANTLASGAIIERGSNANGTYVKFADGTMICTGGITSSEVWNNTSYGFRYTEASEASLPATYNKTPTVVISPNEPQVASRSAWVVYVDATVSSVYNFRLASTSGSTQTVVYEFRYVTIGRWK